MATFRTTLQLHGKTATGIEIPPAVVESLGGGKKPAVKVTLNGKYTYRNTIAVMGGLYMVGVSSEHREASGVKAGDELEVTLELDTEPRTVELPEDLASALASAGLREAFDKSAPSKRKEFVRQVEDAKTAETRQRRIASVVTKLSGG